MAVSPSLLWHYLVQCWRVVLSRSNLEIFGTSAAFPELSLPLVFFRRKWKSKKKFGKHTDSIWFFFPTWNVSQVTFVVRHSVTVRTVLLRVCKGPQELSWNTGNSWRSPASLPQAPHSRSSPGRWSMVSWLSQHGFGTGRMICWAGFLASQGISQVGHFALPGPGHWEWVCCCR